MPGSELGDDSGLRNGLANGSTTFFLFFNLFADAGIITISGQEKSLLMSLEPFNIVVLIQYNLCI